MPAPASIPLNLDGYTDIPAGKVVSMVTYLEMHEPPAGRGQTRLDAYGLDRLSGRSRALPNAFSPHRRPMALVWPRRHGRHKRRGTSCCHPDVEAYALVENGTDIGLLELDFRVEGEAELAYFGLVPGTTGKGIGRSLMDEAIRRAFGRPIRRFFVHTCSLDHPGAVSFYVRSGFRRLQAGSRDRR